MSQTKIGVPNLFMALAFAFCASFFIIGLLSVGSSSSIGMNGFAILFAIIAWLFSGIMSFWLFKNFKMVIIKDDSITVSSFLSKNKKTVKFSDLDYVGWHTDYIHYSKSFHIIATLYNVHGGSIVLSDLELENFDRIMQYIPHENSKAKKRVYQNRAKDEYLTSAIGFLLSAGSLLFFTLKFDYFLYSFSTDVIADLTMEIVFLRVLLPLVHVFIVWAFLKRILRYRRILGNKQTIGNPQKMAILSPQEKIMESFDYLNDRQMRYYAGTWQIMGQEQLPEVYFYAPKEHILESQIDNFDKLLKNRVVIKKELGFELNKRLTLEKHEQLEYLLKQPLIFSVISVLHKQRNHENVQGDHDIELICSKTYNSFGIRRGVDIIAYIAAGKIKRIEK